MAQRGGHGLDGGRQMEDDLAHDLLLPEADRHGVRRLPHGERLVVSMEAPSREAHEIPARAMQSGLRVRREVREDERAVRFG